MSYRYGWRCELYVEWLDRKEGVLALPAPEPHQHSERKGPKRNGLPVGQYGANQVFKSVASRVITKELIRAPKQRINQEVRCEHLPIEPTIIAKPHQKY